MSARAMTSKVNCVPWDSQARAKRWDFTVLAPQPISWRRWRNGRGDRCLPSRGREMWPPRPSPGASARRGRVDPTICRRSYSTLPSSLRPWAISYPWRLKQSASRRRFSEPVSPGTSPCQSSGPAVGKARCSSPGASRTPGN